MTGSKNCLEPEHLAVEEEDLFALKAASLGRTCVFAQDTFFTYFKPLASCRPLADSCSACRARGRLRQMRHPVMYFEASRMIAENPCKTCQAQEPRGVEGNLQFVDCTMGAAVKCSANGGCSKMLLQRIATFAEKCLPFI